MAAPSRARGFFFPTQQANVQREKNKKITKVKKEKREKTTQHFKILPMFELVRGAFFVGWSAA